MPLEYLALPFVGKCFTLPYRPFVLYRRYRLSLEFRLLTSNDTSGEPFCKPRAFTLFYHGLDDDFPDTIEFTFDNFTPEVFVFKINNKEKKIYLYGK